MVSLNNVSCKINNFIYSAVVVMLMMILFSHREAVNFVLLKLLLNHRVLNQTTLHQYAS